MNQKPITEPVILSAAEVELWLRPGPGPATGKIAKLQHDVNNAVTYMYTLSATAQLHPEQVLAKMQLVEDKARRTKELVDQFCQELRHQLTPPVPLVSLLAPRVLVVDDEPSICSIIQLALQAMGECSVVTVGSALEGMQRFHSDRFDLVITDFSMTGMNGRQFAAAIKQRSPQTPVLLVTAYLGKMEESGGVGREFDAWLHKPFELSELIATVNTLLALPRKPCSLVAA